MQVPSWRCNTGPAMYPLQGPDESIRVCIANLYVLCELEVDLQGGALGGVGSVVEGHSVPMQTKQQFVWTLSYSGQKWTAGYI